MRLQDKFCSHENLLYSFQLSFRLLINLHSTLLLSGLAYQLWGELFVTLLAGAPLTRKMRSMDFPSAPLLSLSASLGPSSCFHWDNTFYRVSHYSTLAFCEGTHTHTHTHTHIHTHTAAHVHKHMHKHSKGEAADNWKFGRKVQGLMFRPMYQSNRKLSLPVFGNPSALSHVICVFSLF